MRLFTSVIASAIFLVASSASALTSFGVTTSVTGGRALDDLLPGDQVTVSIRLSGGTNVFGLGASAYGYNESVIDFVSGQAVGSINHALLFPGFFLNGLANTLVPGGGAGPAVNGPLGESAVGASGNRVLFFNGVGLTATNSNAGDYGLDGTSASPQFRIIFQVAANAAEGSLAQILVGTGYNGDGEIGTGGVTDTSTAIAINLRVRPPVVPEPGTALLMGLGLAGLAAAGRRE